MKEWESRDNPNVPRAYFNGLYVEASPKRSTFLGHMYYFGKVGISRAKMFEMIGNFVTSVIYTKRYFKQRCLYCMLNVKGLMA